MNTYSVADLERVLAYAKKHAAATVQIEIKELDNRRMVVTILNVDYNGGDARITVYGSESKKIPTIATTTILAD